MFKKLYILILLITLMMGGILTEETTTQATTEQPASTEEKVPEEADAIEEEKADGLPNINYDNEDSIDFLEDDMLDDVVDIDEAEDAEDIDMESEPTQEEIKEILKESGLSEEDIAQIQAVNDRDPKEGWKDFGEDADLIRDTIGETNEIVRDVNNYSELKKQTSEAEILEDSVGLLLGEENELTPTAEDIKAQEKYEEESKIPLTEEQKEELDDLEDVLAEENEDDYDFIDL